MRLQKLLSGTSRRPVVSPAHKLRAQSNKLRAQSTTRPPTSCVLGAPPTFLPAPIFAFLTPRTFFCRFLRSFLCFRDARFFSYNPCCSRDRHTHTRLAVVTHPSDTVVPACLLHTKLLYIDTKQDLLMAIDFKYKYQVTKSLRIKTSYI